jgi:eukaryotic translation initiation factor 2C
MVASVDRWLGQWPAVRIQSKPRKEMVSDVVDMLKSRLRLWKVKWRLEDGFIYFNLR